MLELLGSQWPLPSKISNAQWRRVSMGGGLSLQTADACRLQYNHEFFKILGKKRLSIFIEDSLRTVLTLLPSSA